jgi:isopentenyldiphosphate isomerase
MPEEIFDVVNEQDEVIGQAPRSECHANPALMHRTVHFTLLDTKNHQLLITQRSLRKDVDAGQWCFLGEHILSGENYPEAVLRGVKEELGVQLHSCGEYAHHIFSYSHQREFVRFFLVDWNGENIHADPQEIIDYRWVTLSHLLKHQADYSTMTQYWIAHAAWGTNNLLKDKME